MMLKGDRDYGRTVCTYTNNAYTKVVLCNTVA